MISCQKGYQSYDDEDRSDTNPNSIDNARRSLSNLTSRSSRRRRIEIVLANTQNRAASKLTVSDCDIGRPYPK
jgi:hypothetical protein